MLPSYLLRLNLEVLGYLSSGGAKTVVGLVRKKVYQ